MNNLIKTGLMTLMLTGSAFAAQELANVNGKPLTDSDLQMALSGTNEGQRDLMLRDPAARKQLIQSLVDQEIMLQLAQKEKLDQSTEYKNGLESYKRQLLANLYVQKRVGNRLTDKDAQNYYAVHKIDFNTDQVHAMHILLSTEAEAKRILDEAKKPKSDFQALAEKFSQDPSAKNNRGDLGYIQRAFLVKEFTDPVFRSAKGQIIGPIKTSFGFHVVKIIDKKPGKTLEYSDVELQVKSALREQAIRGLLTEVRKSAKIKID